MARHDWATAQTMGSPSSIRGRRLDRNDIGAGAPRFCAGTIAGGRRLPSPAKHLRTLIFFARQQPMQGTALTALLAVALAGCATPPGGASEMASTAPPTSGGFVSAVGTPFLWLVKFPACAAVAILTGPVVGASAVVDNDGGQETRHAARNTLHQTCGPPYTL